MGVVKTDEFISGESNNWADHWTPDSKYLLFTSDRRHDVENVFRQSLTDQNPEPLNPADEEQGNALAVWGGNTILYWSSPKAEGERGRSRILNVLNPASSARRVPEKADAELACARMTAVCILKLGAPDKGNKKGEVFTSLDLKNFRTSALPAPQADLGKISDWDVSPDGKTIAIVNGSQSKGVVKLLSVADGSVKEVTVSGWSGLDIVAWSADGETLFVASDVAKRSAVLRVDLTGAASVLWQTESEGLGGTIAPSPDGKYIAFSATSTGESNAWFIQRF